MSEKDSLRIRLNNKLDQVLVLFEEIAILEKEYFKSHPEEKAKFEDIVKKSELAKERKTKWLS